MTHPKIIEAAYAAEIPDLTRLGHNAKRARTIIEKRGGPSLGTIRSVIAAARVLLSIEPSEGMVAAPEDWHMRADGPRYCWYTMQIELRKELGL